MQDQITGGHPPSGFEHLVPERDHGFGAAETWYQLIGPLYRATENPRATLTLGFFSEDRHLNYLKQVHGGMMSAFMDYVLWNVARTAWPGDGLVTISMTVDFVGACPGDTWVSATGELIRAGGSIAFARASVEAAGKIVAHATGSFRRLNSTSRA